MVLHQDKLDLYLTQLNSSSLSKYHTSFLEYGIFAWKMSQFHTKKYDSNFFRYNTFTFIHMYIHMIMEIPSTHYIVKTLKPLLQSMEIH